MFSLTPIEAALWSLGVQAQTYLAKTLFSGFAFLSVAVTFLSWFIYKTIFNYGKDGNGTEILKRIFEYLCIFFFGLMCLRTLSSETFTPTDSSGRSWVSHYHVAGNPHYRSLKNNNDGLYWYLNIHQGFIEVSRFMTDKISTLFGDRGYARSPQMVFKMLVATANVQIDDPKITAAFDRLASECTDSDTAKILEKDEPLAALFTLEKNECRRLYSDFRYDLNRWAKSVMPRYLKRVAREDKSMVPDAVESFASETLLENKMIASSLINYVKTVASSKKDSINTNADALGLRDRWDHFYFNLQRSLSGGAGLATVATLFTDENVEGTLVKNEAGIIYNNLLNLIPSIKGYIKIFVALGFLAAAAGMACGFLKPMIWWLRICLIEMLYEPLSTLNYEIHSILVTSTSVEKAFSSLAHDPLVLMGASIIDSELVHYQATYFITQMAIAGFFVFGVIQAGWAVRSMSFAQGAAVGSLLNSRIVSIGASGATKGVSAVSRSVVGKINNFRS